MGQLGPRNSHRDQGTGTRTSSPLPDVQNPLTVILQSRQGLGHPWAWAPVPTYRLPPSCPQPVVSLTRAGTVRVGPRLGQQVEKHIAQESPQGKAEQLLQAPGSSYKAEMWDLGTGAPEPLA